MPKLRLNRPGNTKYTKLFRGPVYSLLEIAKALEVDLKE